MSSEKRFVSRDHRLLLEDILQSAQRILQFCLDQTREDVFSDPMRCDAVLYNLQVIGEAVKKLPEPFRKRHPEIAWREIAGMRDVIAHAYFALDLDIVWSAIQDDVPTLHHCVQRIIETE